MQTVRISEQELYEICRNSIVESHKVDPISFNSKLRYEVAKNFRLMSQMEKPKTRVSNKAAHRLIIFALVSFLALTLKMGCEGYFQR
jgi:hypothetical protein